MTGGCSPDQSSNPDSRVLLMRFIDEVQTRLWLEKYTIRFDQSGMPTFPASVSLLRSAVPSDSGRKTALSRTIATIFRKDDEALLCRHLAIVGRSLPVPRLPPVSGRRLSPSHEAGTRLLARRSAAVGSLLAMVLYFAWGAILYSPARTLLIHISHDEFISMLGRGSQPSGRGP